MLFPPALTGAVVGPLARSDAFLADDYRQTLADLLADAHYGTVAKVAHGNGADRVWRSAGRWRPVLGDDLTMRSHADVPMAAMWTFNRERCRAAPDADRRHEGCGLGRPYLWAECRFGGKHDIGLRALGLCAVGPEGHRPGIRVGGHSRSSTRRCISRWTISRRASAS